MMKFGCCFGTSPERAALLREAGFDYGEVDIKRFMELDDEAFDAYAKELLATGLPIESGCVYLANGMSVNRKQADYDAIRKYCELSAKRCNMLGLKTIVYGSGGSRNVPEGMTEEEVFEDIVTFLRDYAVPSVEPYGIQIVIEPLEKWGSDMIHTVAEAQKLSDAVGSKWVQLLADVYHMQSENDPIDELPNYKGRLLHAHTSHPLKGKRICPQHNDGYDQTPFIRAVMSTGCPRISIEADAPAGDYLAGIKDAITLLRETEQKILNEQA